MVSVSGQPYCRLHLLTRHFSEKGLKEEEEGERMKDAERGDAGVFGVDVLVKQRSTLAQRHLH